MRIVKPSVSMIATPKTPVELMKHLEWCGRVCYKSENNITDDSYENFLRDVIKRKHFAVLEHGTITMYMKTSSIEHWFEAWIRNYNQFSGNICYLRLSGCYVSGSIRAWRDFLTLCFPHCSLPDDICRTLRKYNVLFEDIINDELKNNRYGADRAVMRALSLKDEHGLIHNRCTLRFVIDRGVSHELVRHRPASFTQESTRYCNYSKGKFGHEITVINPFNLDEGGKVAYEAWYKGCECAEKAYFEMLDGGTTPQIARGVLPNSLKTEVIMTANLAEWAHFINLRSRGTTGAPHPQMREVATRAEELLLKAYPELGDYLK